MQLPRLPPLPHHPARLHHFLRRPPRAAPRLRAHKFVLSTIPYSTSIFKTTVNDVHCLLTWIYILMISCADGQVVLGPESSSGYFTISGGTIQLTGAEPLYLNEDTTATTSYKALTFDSTASTTDWQLEGDTIITTSPRELNFLACATNDANYYTVYLQTGNDQPAGQSCSMQSLHLPCLC